MRPYRTHILTGTITLTKRQWTGLLNELEIATNDTAPRSKAHEDLISYWVAIDRAVKEAERSHQLKQNKTQRTEYAQKALANVARDFERNKGAIGSLLTILSEPDHFTVECARLGIDPGKKEQELKATWLRKQALLARQRKKEA